MTGREEQFDEAIQAGHSAAWDLDWDRAIEHYRHALELFPERTAALTSLGLALLEKAEYKEALAIYHKAARLAPDDPIPVEKCAEVFELLGQAKDAVEQRNNAADLYVRRREVEKALENWSHIARLAPSNLAARSRLALTYERMGQREEAVHEYLAVASVLQKAGNTERAVEAVQRALTITPGDPNATLALRMLRDSKPLPPPAKPKLVARTLNLKHGEPGAHPGAQIILKDVDRINGSDAVLASAFEIEDPETLSLKRALTILAGMLFDDSQDKESRQGAGIFGRSRRAKSDPTLDSSNLRALGESIDLYTRGHKRRAAKLMTQFVEEGFDHPAAHYVLGTLLAELGSPDLAKVHLMKSSAHEDLALGANLALGRMAHHAAELNEAARYLLQAMRLADTLSVDEEAASELNSLYDAISASQAEGDEDALTRIIENILDFLEGPQWLDRIQRARARLQSENEDNLAMVPIAEMLADGGSQRVSGALDRIEKLVESGFLQSAAEEAMMAIQQAPTYLALHARLAELMIQSGRKAAGVEKHQLVARAHEMRGEIKKSIAELEQILKLDPINLSTRRHLIALLISQARYDAALDAYQSLAELHRQMAQIDAARKALAQALQLARQVKADPMRQLTILHQMGDIDLARLDWRQALEVYEQVLQLDPSDHKASGIAIDLNLRLGREDQAAAALDTHLDQLVETNRGLEALTMLEEMTREFPGKQMLHSRLAEAYRAAGRTADAIAQYDALGEIQLDAGQVHETIRTIKTIIELQPPDLEGYQELLRNLQKTGA